MSKKAKKQEHDDDDDVTYYRRVVGREVPIQRIAPSKEDRDVMFMTITHADFTHRSVKGDVCAGMDGTLIVHINDPKTPKGNLGPRYVIKVTDVIEAVVDAHLKNLPNGEAS